MDAAAPPRIVGRYALHEKFAAGGMATIHFGRLLGSAGFSRTVVIKRLREKHAKDPQVVAMLIDEARLAGRIRHPNVVQTLDVVYAEGELFVVLEYVHGDSLAHLLSATVDADEETDWRIVGSIAAGMLHGLHAAHEARSERGEPLGIVHRDVSPQNLLVGEDGVARVVDFGIAKAADRLARTSGGIVKGKLGYMAPEQLRGEATRRSDVFAAGIVLWEALSTRRLFDAPSDLEIVRLLEREPIVAPSQLVPGLPKGYDDVVLRALSRSAPGRFETAHDMALALEKVAPVASASEVGAWVARKAGATLAARSRAIAAIESAPGLSSNRTLGELLGGRPPSTAVPSEAKDGPPRRQGRMTVALVTLGSALFGLTVLGLLLPRSRPPAESPVAPAPPAPTPSPVESVTVEAVPQEAVPLEPLAPLSPDPTPAPSARPKPARSCTPPYVVDARGHMHFKPECM